MENKGVLCDVCECRYNIESNKCSLPQIKVTENCTSCGCTSTQAVETPHYCQNYQKK